MNGLEAFLRKSTTSNEGSSLTKWRRADSEHFTTGRVSRTVSQDGRRNLCCALEDEFHVYNLMIAHSENLDPLAKQETSQEVLRVCSVGAWEELDCPPWSTWVEHSTPSFLRLTLYVSLLEWSTIILLFEFKMPPFDIIVQKPDILEKMKSGVLPFYLVVDQSIGKVLLPVPTCGARVVLQRARSTSWCYWYHDWLTVSNRSSSCRSSGGPASGCPRCYERYSMWFREFTEFLHIFLCFFYWPFYMY